MITYDYLNYVWEDLRMITCMRSNYLIMWNDYVWEVIT